MAKAEIPRGWAIPYIYPTGLFIRDYLKEHKAAYVYEIWDALRKARLSAGVVDAEGRPRVCTYDNFMRNYIYTLKKIGLIELVKKEPSKKAGTKLPRWYYRIVPGRENDTRWNHPQTALDPRRGTPRFRKAYAKERRKRIVARPIPPEELDKVWGEAAAFLREYGYVLTREQLETLNPDWSSKAWLYKTHERRVGYAIRKAVEIEYVSRVARRLIDPKEAPEPIAREARKAAAAIEREWLRRVA